MRQFEVHRDNQLWMLAAVRADLHNQWRGKDDPIAEPSDFMPGAKRQKQSVDEKMQAWAFMMEAAAAGRAAMPEAKRIEVEGNVTGDDRSRYQQIIAAGRARRAAGLLPN